MRTTTDWVRLVQLVVVVAAAVVLPAGAVCVTPSQVTPGSVSAGS